MTIPKEERNAGRFLTALLVHFVRENSEGLIRFYPLRSQHSFLDEKWLGVEFSPVSGALSPRLLVSDLIRQLIVMELIRRGVTSDSGFELEMESGFSNGTVRRHVTPVVSEAGDSPRLDFVVTKPGRGAAGEEDRDDVYVLRVTARDRLPLGMAYLRDLAVHLELQEASVEFENTAFPVVLLVQHLLALSWEQQGNDMLHILPTETEADGGRPILAVVTQGEDGSPTSHFTLIPAMGAYIFPYLKTQAELDPFAVPPAEGILRRPGRPELLLRFENLEGREAVTIRRR